MSASLPLWSIIPIFLATAIHLTATDDELPELEVTAEPTPAAAGFAATSMRLDLHLPDTTTRSLGTGLETLPGITAGGGFGVIDPPRVSIRGSGIQSAPMTRGFQLFHLGMPMQLADGSFNLSLIDPSWAGTATLVRGSAAGVPHLGGALAIGTGDDVFTPNAHLRIGTGSHGFYQFGGGGVIDQHSLRATATGGDGWRPQSAWQRESFLAAWRVPLVNDPPLDILFFASRSAGPASRARQ